MIGARAPASMTASSIMRPSPKGRGRRDHMPLEWSQPLTLTLLVNCAALPAILDVSLHPRWRDTIPSRINTFTNYEKLQESGELQLYDSSTTEVLSHWHILAKVLHSTKKMLSKFIPFPIRKGIAKTRHELPTHWRDGIARTTRSWNDQRCIAWCAGRHPGESHEQN